MSNLHRAARLVLAGLLLWYSCTLLFWAVRPLSDTVPVGIDATLKTPAAVSIRVECSTLFRSAPRPADVLPTLTPQPAGQPVLAYSRTPCVRAHTEARALFVFDTLFAVGGTVLALWLGRRSGDTPAKHLERAPA